MRHLVPILTVFACSSFAYADSITVVGGTLNTNGTTNSGIIGLPGFNNSLGALTGVTIDFGPGNTGLLTSNIGLSDIENADQIDVTYNLGFQVTIDLPGGGSYVPGVAALLNCSGTGSEITTCANSSSIMNPADQSETVPSNQIFLFTLGPVELSFQEAPIEYLIGTPVPSPDPNIDPTVTGNAYIPTEVTFDYTPPGGGGVPEPASIVLAGAGLAAVACLRRRTSSQGN